MKKYIAILLTLITISCHDNDVKYSVDPQLEPYVDIFIAEAQERGVTIPKNNLIAELTDYKAQAIVNATRDMDQKILYVHKGIFDYATSTGRTIEYDIFNGLGELFIPNKVVMTQYEREAFFNDLLK